MANISPLSTGNNRLQIVWQLADGLFELLLSLPDVARLTNLPLGDKSSGDDFGNKLPEWSHYESDVAGQQVVVCAHIWMA